MVKARSPLEGVGVKQTPPTNQKFFPVVQQRIHKIPRLRRRSLQKARQRRHRGGSTSRAWVPTAVFLWYQNLGKRSGAQSSTGPHSTSTWRPQNSSSKTPKSVWQAFGRGDWMAPIDLEDTHFQIPVRTNSRKYLRFVWRNTVYQFKD